MGPYTLDVSSIQTSTEALSRLTEVESNINELVSTL